MIGKILSHLLGSAGEDLEAADDTFKELMEFEEGEWIVVNLPENGALSVSEVDPLENLLIEHPSMSVYQMRCVMSGVEEEEEEEEEEEDGDEEDAPGPVGVRRHVSWRLAAWGAWGAPLPRPVERPWTRTQPDRKRLSRGFLHRQNMARTRVSPSEKRYGYFKQPGQRLYNY